MQTVLGPVCLSYFTVFGLVVIGRWKPSYSVQVNKACEVGILVSLILILAVFFLIFLLIIHVDTDVANRVRLQL